MRMNGPIAWPDGKRFAFTVFDDADYDRMENTRPVYDFLADSGFRTTKSVWPLAAEHEAPLGGLSTEAPEYLAWIRDLQRAGFEIGYHGARPHSSPREVSKRALELFREQFGHDPATASNHFQNADSMYWGAARMSGVARLVYLTANLRNPLRCEGHVEGSEYFWGDLCRERVRYLRNFVFREINTLRACPFMPYHDSARPFVSGWYASAEGGDVSAFVDMIAEANQDRLAAEGGACIMYTHFAKGFHADGQLHGRFVERMKRLASLGGWFVPVGELLDFLRDWNGGLHEITPAERRALEWRWLAAKLRHGSS
jgi:hypothetical protein